MGIKIQIRRDAASSWQSVNPVLAEGELGYETDTGKLKIGDGTTDWNNLPYFAGGGGSPGGSDGSIQYNDGGSSFGGNDYLKWDSTNFQLVIDTLSESSAQEGINVSTSNGNIARFASSNSSAFINVVTTSSEVFRSAGIHFFTDEANGHFGVISYAGNSLNLNTSATSGLVNIRNAVYISNTSLGIGTNSPSANLTIYGADKTALFTGDDFNFGVTQSGGSVVNDRENTYFGVWGSEKIVYVGTGNIELKKYIGTIGTPSTDHGRLFHDSSDHHIKWIDENGTIYDLCLDTTNSPGGNDRDIQFNRSGDFGGDSKFRYNYQNSIPNIELYEVTDGSNLGSVGFGGKLDMSMSIDFTSNSSSFAYAFRISHGTSVDSGITASGEQIGAVIQKHLNGDGNLNDQIGLYIEHGSTDESGSFINDNSYALKINSTLSTGTVTNMYGIYVGLGETTGTITNYYPIYQADNTGLNYFGADTSIGSKSPVANFEVAKTRVLFKDNNIDFAIGNLSAVNSESAGDVYFGINTDYARFGTPLGIVIPISSESPYSEGHGTGTLYADGSDNHLKWIVDETIYDLCLDNSPAGPDKAIQYNGGGVFSGTSNFIYDYSADMPNLVITYDGAMPTSSDGLIVSNTTCSATSNLTDIYNQNMKLHRVDNISSNVVGSIVNFYSYIDGQGTGSLTTQISGTFHHGIATSGQNISIVDSYGFQVVSHLRSGQIDNIYGIDIGGDFAGGSYNAYYPIYQRTAGGINYFASKMGIGTDSPSADVHITLPQFIHSNDSVEFTIGISSVSGAGDRTNTLFGVWKSDGVVYLGGKYTEIKGYSATIPTPATDHGYLYHDTNDHHIKWKDENDNVYDLCEKASPASPNMAIQYNNNGAFGGSSDFTWDDSNKEMTINGSINQTDTNAENHFKWITRFGGDGHSGYIYVYGGIYANDVDGNSGLFIDGNNALIKFYQYIPSENVGSATHPIVWIDENDMHIKYKYQNNLYDLCEVAHPSSPDGSVQFNHSNDFTGSSNFMVNNYGTDQFYVDLSNTCNVSSASYDGVLKLTTNASYDSGNTNSTHTHVIDSTLNATIDGDNPNYMTNAMFSVYYSGSGSLAWGDGVVIRGGINGSSESVTLSNLQLLSVRPYLKSGTIDNIYTLILKSLSNGGTYTNYYGIYQEDANATNVFKGNVLIGDASSDNILHVKKDSSIIKFEGKDATFTFGDNGVGDSSDENNTFFGVWPLHDISYFGLPYIKIKDNANNTTIPSATANHGYLYHDSSDNHLKWVDENSNIYDLCEVASPGGPNTSVQFNNGGSFDGISNVEIITGTVPYLRCMYDSTLNPSSGIFQTQQYTTLNSDLSSTLYSRNVTISREDTINADANSSGEGRLSNLWSMAFAKGSGSLYSQNSLIVHHGIYSNSESLTIQKSTGIAVTTYCRSGTLSTAYGIYTNVATGGTINKYYSIYQDGSIGLNILEGRLGIGGEDDGFTQTLRVIGNTLIRGDDTYFVHGTDDWPSTHSDDDVYFGSFGSGEYILVGVDYIKISETTATISTPQSGYGNLFTQNKNLYWLDSDGNKYLLNNVLDGQLSPSRVVLTDTSGKLTTNDIIQYIDGGGILVDNATEHILRGTTSKEEVINIVGTNEYSSLRFDNIYNSNTTRFEVYISSPDDTSNPHPNSVTLTTTVGTTFILAVEDLEIRGQTDLFRARFSTDGRLLLSDKNSGGTASTDPNALLTLYGDNVNISLDNTEATSNDIYIDMKTQYNTWTFRNMGSSSGDLYIQNTNSGSSTQDIMILKRNGYVGIGTDPSYKLDVDGSIRYSHSFVNRLQFTVPASTSKWVRIAESGSSAGRNNSIFRIKYTMSGYHGHKIIYIGGDFGRENGFCVNVLGSDYYGGDVIPTVRILDNDTYDVMYIELYCTNTTSSNTLSVTIEQDNISDNGWNLYSSAVDGSIPTDYAERRFNIRDMVFSVGAGTNNTTLSVDRYGRTFVGNNTTNPRKLNVNGDTQIFNSNAAPTALSDTLLVETNMSIYSNTSSDSIQHIGFYDTGGGYLSAIINKADAQPIELRFVSNGVITFSSNESNVFASSLTDAATLTENGTFRAKYFRPTSNYQSVAGNGGVTISVTLLDGDGSTKWKMDFENGILVSCVSTS